MATEPETLQELLARIVTLEAEKAALKQEAIDQRLKYKTARERAAALEAENERFKADHGLVGPGGAADEPPIADDANAVTEHPATESPVPATFSDADRAAVLRAIATFEDRVKKECLDDCVAAALASGVGAAVSSEDFPPEVFERRGASGTGGRAPKPAAPVSTAQEIDWGRYRVDSSYRDDPKVKAMVAEESRRLQAQGRHA